jgi:glycosyltransferase involved in cell wall biosynthesis
MTHDRSAAADVPVTMIVTGYNQSHLIEEAIQGAFDQTHSNLQIILTDDCSTDDTHARMCAAAERYQGPHRVLVNRPPRNLGTYGNIHHAFAQATGDLIVFAGGDDVSYPQRSTAVARCWRETGADAFYSSFDIIDEHGQVLERNFTPIATTLFIIDYFPGDRRRYLYGASTACHRSVLERFPAPPRRIRSEDTYLTLMVTVNGGRVERIEEALVAYRKHEGAITNVPVPVADRGAIEAHERKQMSLAVSMAELLELFRAEVDRLSGDARLKRFVDDDIALFRLKATYADRSLVNRLLAIPLARRRRELGWLLPRIVGLTTFARMKKAVLTVRARSQRNG